MSKPTKIYANEHPKFKKKDKNIKVASAEQIKKNQILSNIILSDIVLEDLEKKK